MKGVKCVKYWLFYLLFISVFAFINQSGNANAWETTDPYFDDTQTFTVYRSYMTQADGAPYIVNGDSIPNFSINYNIINQTDSALQTKTLFGFLVGGYELNGDDKNKTYHSAQAVFYFISPYSSYFNFGTAKARAKYVLTDDNGGNLDQWVDCSIVHTQDTQAPYTISHFFECPQVTIRRQGYYYRWVDLYVGETNDNDFNSSYYYKFRDGGGFKIAPAVGQYVVSSSDNATELALERTIYQNEVIINQNQTIIDNQNEIKDFLTDDTPPSADTSTLGNSAGWLPAGPVDSILTLPISFAQGILGIFTGSHNCSPINLPLSLGPYSFNLAIPCMDSYFSLASINIVWNVVGIIISAFVIYKTLKWLYKFVDETLSFRENNSGMWGGL